MVYYKKMLFVITGWCMLICCLQVQAEEPSLREQFMVAKLTYIDMDTLARYYGDESDAAMAIRGLKAKYVDMCVAGRLLELIRLAQSAIHQLGEPEHAESRFMAFLSFLDGGTDKDIYIRMLEILARSKRHDSISHYPFSVRLFLRLANAVGLTAQHPLDQLREACESIAQNTFFVENRMALIQFVRDAFNNAEGEDALGHIDQAVEALEERFAQETRTLFAEINQLLPVLMDTHLPVFQRTNPSARDARRHLFQRAVQFQEILRPPSLRNQDPFLNTDTRAGALRAGVGVGASGIPARL